MIIRTLFPETDLARLAAFYAEAADYWLFADRRAPDAAKAAAFFTDTPPGADPIMSHRLGLFENERLAGVAELSFGFPDPQDAYLGLMLLGPKARGKGHGAAFLAHTEALARAAHAPRLYLAVLEENLRGRAFWQREGFRPTGLRRVDADTGHCLHRLVKDL